MKQKLSGDSFFNNSNVFLELDSEFFKLNAAHYGSQHNNRFRICYAELTLFKFLFREYGTKIFGRFIVKFV